MQQQKANAEYVLVLKRDLQQVRTQSLEATRKGDFMRVARLTAQAAQLNREIMECEGIMIADTLDK